MNWLGNFIVENLVWIILASFVITMIGGWLMEKKRKETERCIAMYNEASKYDEAT